MNRKPRVGERVRSLRAFMGVPKGTIGVCDEDYGSGVTIAWDLEDRPLPKDWKFDLNDSGTWAINPKSPLRDGFGIGELAFLELVSEE